MKFLGWVFLICCYMLMHCITFAFSQCFMHLDVCFYVGNLCAGRIGLGLAHDEFFFTCHILLHCSYIRTFSFSFFWYSLLMVLFCLDPSLSNSLRMAPKHKTTPSRNPLCSGASSFNSNPLHVKFRDEKSHQDFLENFSKLGVHSERRMILLDFSYTDLPTVIHRWGWESLCKIPVSYPTMIIQEFYSNMHDFDSFVPRLLLLHEVHV